jgi:hypothetical protein
MMGNNLIVCLPKLDNLAPQQFLPQQILHVDITQPIFETISTDKSIEERCRILPAQFRVQPAAGRLLKEFEPE